VFILSIIADFVVGVWIEKFSAHKKVLLTIGISLHLISLAAFKYSGFVINEIGRLNPSFNFTADIVLPIGISFYTFQGISYIVDVYRGTTKAQQSLLKYTIYISMFEQLIAGPIVTYGQVEKELYKRQIKTSSVLRGIGIFIFGLGLKVLLANPIGKLW
jgi:alginate O-acetyltransferase complex protein AlgI